MLVSKYKKSAAAFILLFVAYLILVLLLPVDKATLVRFHLTRAQYMAVLLTVVIPYLIIGFVAMIGYLRFPRLHRNDPQEQRRGGFPDNLDGYFVAGALVAYFGRGQ